MTKKSTKGRSQKNPTKTGKPKVKSRRTSKTPLELKAEREGGQRSLLGYIYQLLGNVEEIVKFSRIDLKKLDFEDTLALEAFGQDSFVACTSKDGRTRFIQYKHTETDEAQPAFLLAIMRSFIDSVESAKVDLEACEFRLRMSHRLSPKATEVKKAIDTGNKREIAKGLWGRANVATPENADQLLAMCDRLSIEDELSMDSFGDRTFERFNELGVLESERKAAVSRTIGELLNVLKLGSWIEVSGPMLDAWATGIPNAESFRCDESRERQKRHIADEIDAVADIKRVFLRDNHADLLTSIISSPLTTVLGKGGRGKSVGVFKTLLEAFQSVPDIDFMLVRCFRAFDLQSFSDEIHRWRNQLTPSSVENKSILVQRLKIGSTASSLLVVFVDGIDEQRGLGNAWPDKRRLVNELIGLAVESHHANKSRVSVVLSCRRIEEIVQFVHERFVPLIDEAAIEFGDLDDNEILQAAKLLESPVSDYIQSLLEPRTLRTHSGSVQWASTLDFLKEPRVWSGFQSMESHLQLSVLKGQTNGLTKLRDRYLAKVTTKAGERLQGGIAKHAIPMTIDSILRMTLQQQSERFGPRDWRDICNEVGLGSADGESVYDELLSMGLIHEEEERKRSWQLDQPWLLQTQTRGNYGS